MYICHSVAACSWLSLANQLQTNHSLLCYAKREEKCYMLTIAEEQDRRQGSTKLLLAAASKTPFAVLSNIGSAKQRYAAMLTLNFCTILHNASDTDCA